MPCGISQSSRASSSGHCSKIDSTPENPKQPESAVPDVLAPGLTAVFCGINPGRASAAAHAHFANPRNDFWRLLHASGFTPRQLEPAEQLELLELGYGITNAASRTTPGSGDLRRADFADSAERLERIAVELRPAGDRLRRQGGLQGHVRGAARARRPVAQAGDDGALRAAFDIAGERCGALGGEAPLVPGVSHVAVRIRRAVRAIVLDPDDRILLVRFSFPARDVWATPGGGIDEGETAEEAIRRELGEETGLEDVELGPWIWTREHLFPFLDGKWDGQAEQYVLVRTEPFEPVPRFTPEQLTAEYVAEVRWWTLPELLESEALFAPRRLPELLATLLQAGPPEEPLDVGV